MSDSHSAESVSLDAVPEDHYLRCPTCRSRSVWEVPNTNWRTLLCSNCTHRWSPDPGRDERVLDAIDRWHAQPASTGELHDFLGWTSDEYSVYVERGELPPAREGAA